MRSDTARASSSDVATHLNEIMIRYQAARASTDPWIVAELEFQADLHRRAIDVCLASRVTS